MGLAILKKHIPILARDKKNRRKEKTEVEWLLKIGKSRCATVLGNLIAFVCWHTKKHLSIDILK